MNIPATVCLCIAAAALLIYLISRFISSESRPRFIQQRIHPEIESPPRSMFRAPISDPKTVTTVRECSNGLCTAHSLDDYCTGERCFTEPVCPANSTFDPHRNLCVPNATRMPPPAGTTLPTCSEGAVLMDKCRCAQPKEPLCGVNEQYSARHKQCINLSRVCAPGYVAFRDKGSDTITCAEPLVEGDTVYAFPGQTVINPPYKFRVDTRQECADACSQLPLSECSAFAVAPSQVEKGAFSCFIYTGRENPQPTEATGGSGGGGSGVTGATGGSGGVSGATESVKTDGASRFVRTSQTGYQSVPIVKRQYGGGPLPMGSTPTLNACQLGCSRKPSCLAVSYEPGASTDCWWYSTSQLNDSVFYQRFVRES